MSMQQVLKSREFSWTMAGSRGWDRGSVHLPLEILVRTSLRSNPAPPPYESCRIGRKYELSIAIITINKVISQISRTPHFWMMDRPSFQKERKVSTQKYLICIMIMKIPKNPENLLNSTRFLIWKLLHQCGIFTQKHGYFTNFGGLWITQSLINWSKRERSGSVVECLTRDRRAAGSSLTGVTALWSLSKTHLS